MANPRCQPRDVKFRENARLFNDPFLFPEMEEDRVTGRPAILISRLPRKRRLFNDPFLFPEIVTGRPAILLFHGYQELGFIHLGIPNSKSGYNYILRTGNLLELPQDVTHPGPPVEDTSFKDTITLKEQIAKWLRDHGG